MPWCPWQTGVAAAAEVRRARAEPDSWSRARGTGLVEQGSLSRTRGAGLVEQESWSRSCGAGLVEQDSCTRTRGAGLVEQVSWSRTGGLKSSPRWEEALVLSWGHSTVR